MEIIAHKKDAEKCYVANDEYYGRLMDLKELNFVTPVQEQIVKDYIYSHTSTQIVRYIFSLN